MSPWPATAQGRLLEMNRNLAQIVGIELLAATQGIGLRAPLETSAPLRAIVALLRKRVPALTGDRYLAEDLRVARDLVAQGSVVGEVAGLPRLSR